MLIRIVSSLVTALMVAACGGEKDASSADAIAQPAAYEEIPPMTNSRDPFAQARSVEAPRHDKRPIEITQHGDLRVDHYDWMRVENWQEVLRDPSLLQDQVREALDAENAYYAAVTDDLSGLRETIKAEMRARIKENDSSPPLPDGPWKYWREYREGGEYPVYYRAPRSGGAAVVLYDGDAEKGDAAFFSIGAVLQSPDHSLAAITTDRLGSEYYEIVFRDLEAGIFLPDVIENADGDSIAWTRDSKALYYIERDENQRPKRVKRHALGTPPASDPVIYEEAEDGFFLGVSKSQSGEYIFITSSNATTSEVRYLRADDAEGAPSLIEPRVAGVEYYAEHHGDAFYLQTNADDAVDFKIVTAPIDNPGREQWRDWAAHETGVNLISFTPYKEFLVRLERKDALPRIVISTYDGESYEATFDEAAYALGVSPGFEYETSTLRYTYESPSTPEETYDFDMATRDRVLLKKQEIPSGHDASRYVVERIFARADDGAEIPMTILRLKTTPVDGSAPAVLYGYGAYGITIPASFSTNILSFVDRGVVYAIAHVRGGAAKGRQWYLDGKLEQKTNSFTDFNAAAEALASRGYASAERIVSYGGSAGGLLVAAAANLRPELYAGVVAQVPFVDVLNTISDGTLPLTPPEWEEWGDPITDDAAYRRMRSYSPYENIQNTNYPPILSTGGLTDYRVTYWEMAKWTARLRDDAEGGPFLLRMNMGAGHGGSAARFEALDERAHVYAFALKALGVGVKAPGEQSQ